MQSFLAKSRVIILPPVDYQLLWNDVFHPPPPYIRWFHHFNGIMFVFSFNIDTEHLKGGFDSVFRTFTMGTDTVSSFPCLIFYKHLHLHWPVCFAKLEYLLPFSNSKQILIFSVSLFLQFQRTQHWRWFSYIVNE